MHLFNEFTYQPSILFVSFPGREVCQSLVLGKTFPCQQYSFQFKTYHSCMGEGESRQRPPSGHCVFYVISFKTT